MSRFIPSVASALLRADLYTQQLRRSERQRYEAYEG